jgi:hypothetical protein
MMEIDAVMKNTVFKYDSISTPSSVLQLLVTANVPSSPILVTLMKETRLSTQRNIPEDTILHSHRRENLKTYRALTGWVLYRRGNVSPVKYELGFYIPEEGILHSHCR